MTSFLKQQTNPSYDGAFLMATQNTVNAAESVSALCISQNTESQDDFKK